MPRNPAGGRAISKHYRVPVNKGCEVAFGEAVNKGQALQWFWRNEGKRESK